MTKTSIQKLKHGIEVFNINTGEVVKFISILGAIGEAIYLETLDNNGMLHIWSCKNIEKV